MPIRIFGSVFPLPLAVIIVSESTCLTLLRQVGALLLHFALVFNVMDDILDLNAYKLARFSTKGIRTPLSLL